MPLTRHAPHPVPGHLDGWSPVQFSTLIPVCPRDPAPRPSPTPPDELLPTDQRSGRTRILPITAAAVALVLAGGSAAFAHAQKSVTLDVDGEVTQLSTFAGSVDGLLEDQGVVVGARDEVSRDGRAARGRRDRRAPRAPGGGHASTARRRPCGRPRCPPTRRSTRSPRAVRPWRSSRPGPPPAAARSSSLDLALHGPADVLVDGTTLAVPDADASVAQVLGELGVTLNPLDRVSVVQSDTGRVQVVVNRVAVQDVTTDARGRRSRRPRSRTPRATPTRSAR